MQKYKIQQILKYFFQVDVFLRKYSENFEQDDLLLLIQMFA